MAIKSSSVQQSQEISGLSAGLCCSDSTQLQSNRDAGVTVAQSIASQELGAPNLSTGEALLVVLVLL